MVRETNAAVTLVRFHEVVLGKPYHAALVVLADVTDPFAQQHFHSDYFEFVFVLEGSGHHLLESTSAVIRPHDLLLVRPGDLHGIVPDRNSRMTWIRVAFPASTWHQFVAAAGVDREGEWELSDRPLRQSTSKDVAERLEAAFRRALRAYNEQPTTLDLFRVLLEATEAIQGAASPKVGVDTGRPPWLVQAVSAMRIPDNLRGGVPRLLALASVSAGYLARSVRRHYGMTPSALVAEMRVQFATTLLTTTEQPIGQISETCGFANQAYFSRCFRRETGLSPRAFRAQAVRAGLP